MKYKPLQIDGLTAKIPLIQGGMGVGVSLGNLAGAVAARGGVGIISSAQIGYREADFDTDVRAANKRAIRQEYDKARALAPDGIIGFNIMVALRHYAEHVQAAAAAGADLIISGAGLPTELPKLVEGYDVKLAPIVSSAKSAQVIMKYWDRKYQRIPDLLVIEGPQAGGHLGFSKAELENYTENTYNIEIQKILAVKAGYEEKYERRIPVALAGGIESAADAAKAFALGVDAVQVATRFITTEECDASEAYKMAYVNAKEEDIVITTSPVGMPGRAIENEFIRSVNAGWTVPHSPCHQCLARCRPDEIPYCITDSLTAAARGDVQNGLLFSGAKGYKATEIQTVNAVIDELMGEDD